jgi:hypothetical protein
MKNLLLIIASIGMVWVIQNSAIADAGVTESTGLLTLRGGAGSYFSTVGGGSNERWAGKNLGLLDLAISGDTLTLNNFFLSNYAWNGGSTPAGASTNNNWLDGSSTAVFNVYRNSNLLQSVNMRQSAVTGNDRSWDLGVTPPTINLLAGITGSGSPVTHNVSWTVDWTFNQWTGTQSTVTTQSTSGGNLTFQTVPEPSSASLMALGTAALLALRRRRKA